MKSQQLIDISFSIIAAVILIAIFIINLIAFTYLSDTDKAFILILMQQS